MLLEIPVLTPLRDKAVGCENDHAPRGQPLHVRQHPPAVLFVQMLDDVQSDAGVKPAAGEDVPEVLNVPRKILIMSSSPASLFQGRGVTFKADKMHFGQEAQRGAISTSYVEHCLTVP